MVGGVGEVGVAVEEAAVAAGGPVGLGAGVGDFNPAAGGAAEDGAGAGGVGVAGAVAGAGAVGVAGLGGAGARVRYLVAEGLPSLAVLGGEAAVVLEVSMGVCGRVWACVGGWERGACGRVGGCGRGKVVSLLGSGEQGKADVWCVCVRRGCYGTYVGPAGSVMMMRMQMRPRTTPAGRAVETPGAQAWDGPCRSDPPLRTNEAIQTRCCAAANRLAARTPVLHCHEQRTHFLFTALPPRGEWSSDKPDSQHQPASEKKTGRLLADESPAYKCSPSHHALGSPPPLIRPMAGIDSGRLFPVERQCCSRHGRGRGCLLRPAARLAGDATLHEAE